MGVKIRIGRTFNGVLTATLVEPRVTPSPSLNRTKTRFAAGSKGHRAASLDEDPKGWRGVGVDRRRHGRTDCRDALPVAQGRVDETNFSHKLSYSVNWIAVKPIKGDLGNHLDIAEFDFRRQVATIATGRIIL